MITLVALRLVNWHYFRDTLIPFGERTLLAGDNGSGKSTIVDALQYALAVDLRKFRFNAAAAEQRSGRDLVGYVRCKLGADSAEYLRGDAVGHVMLEFTTSEGHFAAGASVDAFSDGHLVERFWIADCTTISELKISDRAGKPLSSKSFRDNIAGAGGLVFDSKRDYLRELTNRLGVWRRNAQFNPYIEALTRSVSFSPLVSVDKFVCDYILEDRPVDISTMKANLESYKEAEREASLVMSRIDTLELANAALREIRQYESQIVLQEYLKLKVDLDLGAEVRLEARRAVEETAVHITNLGEEIALRENERGRLESSRREAEAALARNDARQLYERLREQAEELGRKLTEARRKADRHTLLRSQCEVLLSRPVGEDDEAEAGLADAAKRESGRDADAAARNREANEAALRDATGELLDLKRGVSRYPESTVRLRDALEAGSIPASVFADLAEVNVDEWRDAAEGWLNTQRFAVLVEPECFQCALEIYDALPRSVGGALLPNLARMRDARVRHGSLAEVISTDSPYARLYADYVLGDVMRASIGDLKTWDKAITKDCMSYSRHTASRVKEEVYSRPFLGRAARERRIEELGLAIEERRRDAARLEDEERRARERENALDRVYRAFLEAASLRPAIMEAEGLECELGEVTARIESFDISSFHTLEEELERLRAGTEKLGRILDELRLALGAAKEKKSANDRELARSEEDFSCRNAAFAAFSAENASLASDCEVYAAERLRSSTLREIRANYDSALKGTQTRLENSRTSYRKIVLEYDSRHNALLPADPSGADEVAALLAKLRDSELPAYREKIVKARADAEREFKEHFVARLAEYIETAKESFKEINETLRDIAFGRDRYRFTLEERSDRRDQLTVIRDAARIEGFGDGLFAQLVDPEEHRAAERLFERILKADLDSAELRSICDYRTYYTYDIKMQDQESLDPASGKPVELSLAKVIREKSGGESQTPYYVAIAASFYRFYREKPEETIRLVIFDEAFNRMDDARIGKALEFFERLNMQLVVAVPTETIRYVVPWMDRANLVVRHGRSAAVRDFSMGADE